MKKIVKKIKGICLLLLCACLLSGMAVYAQGDKDTLNSDSIPDYNVWMAQTMIHGPENAGNGLYPMFQSFKEPVYKELGGYLLDDKPLVSMSAAWSVFFNSEYRNQFANEQKYIYEVLLMEYLKYDSESNSVSRELSNNCMQFSMKLYDILAKELGGNTYDYIKDMTVEEAVSLYEKVETIEGLNTALSKVKGNAENVTQLIRMLSEYQALRQVKEERVYLLKKAKETCEKSNAPNKDFIKAAGELIQTIDSSPLEYAQGKALDVLWGKLCDKAWDLLGEINPILSTIELTVSGLDVCFDSTNKASNNLKLALLYTTDCYMKQGMMKATEEFLNAKTAENGKTFNACFRAYVQFQIYGNDFANTWLEGYLNSGSAADVINAIFYRENIETAKQMIEFCKSQADTRKRLLQTVDKYGDIYKKNYGSDAWKELLETKIPVTGVSFKNSEVTLKNRNDSFVVHADIAPHNATNQNITYTSSNPSVLEVPKNGGFATIKGSGTATVTAKTEDGGFTATQKVTVGNGTSLSETNGGKCGDNVWWKLFDDGTLYIYGEGEMDSWSSGENWDPAKEEIKKVIIEDGVENIGDYMFSNCNNLSDINIPESITSIGSGAFMECTNLKKINLPNHITDIGFIETFSSCSSLESINIPSGVTSIGRYAFLECKNLKEIRISDGLEFIDFFAFSGCSSLKNIYIPDSVEKIKYSAFSGCSSLAQVNIPKKVKKIEESVFSECASLKSITFPSKIMEIEGYVFEGCKGLKEIIFLGNAPLISSNAFYQIEAIARYMPGDATWTSGVMKDYGGTITWCPIGSSEGESGGNSGGSSGTKPTQKKNQIISASNITKTIGDKPFYVGAKQTVGNGALSYTSSNPKVATIASNGKITLKETGTTNITIRAGATAAYNAASKTIKLTVKPRMVSSIKLSAPSTKIAAGKNVKLTAELSPAYASNKGLKWKSSNTKVAKVDSKGNVTFSKKAGGKKVTITAYAKDGSGKKKSYKFTVMKGSVKKVSISGAKSVKAGKSLKLKAKVSASKGANKKMKWKSSNTKYAKVSSSGKVTTYKKGRGKKVKITVYAVDGSNKKKTVVIKIK